MTHKKPETGNALFLILIAVALFAALSYAVISSSRSSGGNISNEKMDLAFNEMQGVVVAHRTALQRMFMSGVDINSVDAFAPIFHEANNTACTSDGCKLYNPKGGGLIWYPFQQLHPDLTDGTAGAPATEINAPSLTWVSNAGTPTIDFIYIFRVTEAFCNFINTKLGLTTPTSAMTPASIGIGYSLKTIHTPSAFGPLDHEYGLGTSGQAPYLEGKTEGCMKITPATRFYYVALIYAN